MRLRKALLFKVFRFWTRPRIPAKNRSRPHLSDTRSPRRLKSRFTSLRCCDRGATTSGLLSNSELNKMQRPEGVDTFEYSSDDFSFSTNTWAPGSPFELSKFDLELRKRWDKAMKGGAFRYDIDHITTRIIPGPKHYVAQLNLLRAKERRKPQDIRSITQPFNPKQFNFTWVGPHEIIFYMRHKETASSPKKSVLNNIIEMENDTGDGSCNGSSPAACDQTQQKALDGESNGETGNQRLETASEERHALVINVSPMEYGHTLLVPQIDQCLPQVLTETSIRVALEMTLLSKHRGLRMGFNSLCAFASVNHLHLHAYYLEHELVVEYCPVEHLTGSVYEITTIPVPGFGFQLHGSTVQEVSRQVHKVSSYFQEADIAHNLFICRGTVFDEKRGSENTTVRVFIWPRRKFVGTKSAEEFNVASIELGGHLPIREEDGYHSLTEESVDAIIADSQLPPEHYQQIKKHITDMFTPTPSKSQS
ncbi:hypothetical protein BaRGS_00003824 [Batillaria attramentaria]|uniref:GDP-D-glucose phosphorylase 1 n=1 Tax=Batillaria attramentaria TaxID=370345 RepID=A0ABD0M0F1_9CAEN